MISEVYEAFRSAGVSDDKARAAAEALSAEQLATKADVAKLETTLTAEIARLEKTLTAEITKLEKTLNAEIVRVEKVSQGDIAKVEKELMVIKWMLGVVIAAVVLPLIKAFVPS